MGRRKESLGLEEVQKRPNWRQNLITSKICSAELQERENEPLI